MRAATPTRRSNMDEKNPLSNFTERTQFFLFQNDFRDSFQSPCFQDFDKKLKGGCLAALSICNCSRPPFRLPGAITPVTPVNAPLVGLAPRVQEIWWLWENLWNFIGQGSVELEHIDIYWLLTSGSQTGSQSVLFGVCVNELNEPLLFFFGGGREYNICIGSVIYIYINILYIYTVYIYQYIYIYVYLAQYELLIVGNITFCTLSETSSQRSGLSLCRVYTPQQRKMRRRNHPPKKNTDSIWVVCVPLGQW